MAGVGVRELDLDLDAFQGPFDLLLAILLREEISLSEVPLGEIVIAYLDHLGTEFVPEHDRHRRKERPGYEFMQVASADSADQHLQPEVGSGEWRIGVRRVDFESSALFEHRCTHCSTVRARPVLVEDSRECMVGYCFRLEPPPKLRAEIERA